MNLTTTADDSARSALTDVSDAALFERTTSGDTTAFRELFDRHVRVVRGFMIARVGPDAAEDLLIETFTVAWSSRDRFDPRAVSARPWLFGIAARLVQRHRALESAWHQGIEAGARSIDPTTDGGLPGPHLDETLRVAIASLKEPEREMLLLVALGELKVSEAATAVGITAVAARLRLHRARRHLTAALEQGTLQ